MAKTKGITGCTILKPLTPAAAERAIRWLTEMSLKNAGMTADITIRERKPGETTAIILEDGSADQYNIGGTYG